MLKNDLYLRALRREPLDRTPVWIMRQAGRYLPEYRATRAKAGDFLSLCKSAELATEVALQPLERFPLDAAILFSDILTIPDAMGLGLRFSEGEGPVFDNPIRDRSAIDALPGPEVMSQLTYVTDAVRSIHNALAGRVPLIGFSGSPWTLLVYMVEGRGTREFYLAKGLVNDDPEAAHQLLKCVTDSVIDYLSAQVEAGADALMVFDTWGGVLPHATYRSFSLDYLALIVSGLKSRHPDTPVTLFTKGGGQWLELIADTGCDAIGIDWTTSLAEANQRVGDRVALQGNLDPVVLNSAPDVVRRHARACLDEMGDSDGHVFNLGHGIHPGVDPDTVAALVDEVGQYSTSLRAS